jgi:large subunit ribosomal protein L4
MPKKALRAATRMALAARLADDEVKLVSGLELGAPKTAVVAKLLKTLGISEKTVLVAPAKHDDMLWKSARNIDGVSVSPVGDLNAWSLLQPRAVLMTTAAIDAFRASVAKVAEEKKAAAGKTAGATKKPSARRGAAKAEKPAASKRAEVRKPAARAARKEK